MREKCTTYAATVAMAAAVLGVFYWPQSPARAESHDYKPVIDPANFVPQVNNKYFTLKPGTKFTYKKQTTEGTGRVEIVVSNETKKVMGVTTTVVKDKVWLNDKVIEDTIDLYAQDKDGNVWYFGEAVNNYKDGKLQDHEGSWQAGVDGARPGIIMFKDPKPGITYRQEYYKGKAEDMGTVIAVGKKVTTPYGSFDDCLQTRDWSLIDKTINEYKYYCPNVAFMTVAESATPSGGEKTELASIAAE